MLKKCNGHHLGKDSMCWPSIENCYFSLMQYKTYFSCGLEKTILDLENWQFRTHVIINFLVTLDNSFSFLIWLFKIIYMYILFYIYSSNYNILIYKVINIFKAHHLILLCVLLYLIVCTTRRSMRIHNQTAFLMKT